MKLIINKNVLINKLISKSKIKKNSVILMRMKEENLKTI